MIIIDYLQPILPTNPLKFT